MDELGIYLGDGDSVGKPLVRLYGAVGRPCCATDRRLVCKPLTLFYVWDTLVVIALASGDVAT